MVASYSNPGGRPAPGISKVSPLYLGLAFLAALALSGCGGQHESTAGGTSASYSAGQVAAPSTAPKVTYFAAARFLEQATWGATPERIAEVQALGFEAWIERQFSLPVTQIKDVPRFVTHYNGAVQDEVGQAYQWPATRSSELFFSEPDQLRQRTSWALFNYIPLFVQPYGMTEHYNLLHRNAFGSHKTLLVELTKSPAMGFFLSNFQNTSRRLNENYARELMQLFTVGLVQLNADGSIKRDADGRPLETYTQEDVRGATRALTGWRLDNSVPNLPFPGNHANFGFPMVQNEDSHDKEAKRVMGKTIPAGQSVQKDLDSLITILVDHPNAGPFLARRLIQSMVASEPSPQYISRVVTAYRSAGNSLRAAVKAVLLDPEARAGDRIGQGTGLAGRMKDSLLTSTTLLAGLGCDRPPDNYWMGYGQSFFDAPNVFGFISPDYRTPGSLVNVPEQTLLTSKLLSARSTAAFHPPREDYLAAGCEIDKLEAALAQSDEAFLNELGLRFFRGAMPTRLRSEVKELMSRYSGARAEHRFNLAMSLLLSSVEFGVVE